MNRKPQRPGHLLLFEEHYYQIVPTRPTDPKAYVEAVRVGEPVLADVRPYAGVRMHFADLTRAVHIDAFVRVLHAQAITAAERFKGDPAYGRRLPEAAVVLANAMTLHLVAGKTVWYAADRLFANPDRVSITVGA